ncbi:MAG: restriction endonuclease subunit S [Chlamydiia bacterium]|jgi:type I restriction enzyme S subunit
MTTKKLPKGWSTCLLEDLITRMSNGANVQQYDEKFGYPITRIETIWNESIDLTRIKFIKENDVDFVEKYRLEPGDILFSHINSDSHLGKTAVFKNQTNTLIHGMNLLLIRPSKKVLSEFLNYQFKFLRNSGAFVDIAQRAVNQSSINQKKLKSLIFLLPPLNEQKRIVAKVEELFSELDMGLENLKKAQELLKVYRQALLKNAFEGKLTEEWRKMNLRSASSKPKPLTHQKHEITTLPSIPLEWEYASLGQFIKCIEAGKSFKCEEREPTSHEVGVAKVSAVTWGEYNESESKTCNDPTKINSKLYVNEGDFLFSRANTIDLVGACVIVKQVKKNIMLSDKTLRIKFNISDPTYILWYLRSITGRNEIMKRSTGNQDSMRNIGQERIRSILLPLCSEDEQLEIIRILNEKLLGIEDLERKINNELQRSQSLRQSILKKAFSGELVTHNPNDEPVSVLLDRIKSEKNDPNSSSKKSKKLQKVAL